MKRKLLEQLIEWKESKKRLPLLLEGARQVGKTYLLKTLFGEKYFEKVIHVNFEKADSELINLFEGNIQPQRIIDYLALKFNTPISQDNTLIIFDEIQEVPRALTSLKYFAEDAPKYYVVAIGSLLGIALHSGTSFPVGKVNRLRLYQWTLRSSVGQIIWKSKLRKRIMQSNH